MQTTIEGVSFTHKLLWKIAQEQADISRRQERGWVNFSLVASVFASHVVEAYINYVGQHLDPARWADERNAFRKPPYQGREGKLRRILELTRVPWEPDARPLKTILELQDLRDAIAHGKHERYSGVVEDDCHSSLLPNPKIGAMVFPRDRLDVVMDDVQALADAIHHVAAEQIDDHFFKATALDGPTEWVSGASSL